MSPCPILLRVPNPESRVPQQGGFSLIELIIVIVIGGIVASMASVFITRPVQGYLDAARRAQLLDAADTALTRMAREIRGALPNSLRVAGGGTALELIPSVDGTRYRDDAPGNTDQRLAVGSADASFSTLGAFTRLPTRPFTSTSHFISVYNLGQPGADAYTGANVITAPGTSISIDADPLDATSDRVTLGTATTFNLASPGQRVYLAETPVSYLCDTAAGTLRRYRDYTLSATQPATHAALLAAGASHALLADRVTACDFTYSAGSATRAALTTLTLTLSDSGESVRLVVQAHVVNTP